MNLFHHLGIFVKNLEYGQIEISKFIEISSTSDEIIDEEIGVKIIFVKDNQGILYELVAPFGDNSPVKGALSRGKDLLNHIAYKTNTFDLEIEKLRNAGFVPLGPAKKAKAFEGSRVIFFLSTLGFIIELVEDNGKL